MCTAGEGGYGLSGGERRRVCIARALLKDAPVRLLDEPTSALDAESAAAIGRMLAALRERKTIVVVTHRLDWFSEADQLPLLERGQVKWKGTPAAYAALFGLTMT